MVVARRRPETHAEEFTALPATVISKLIAGHLIGKRLPGARRMSGAYGVFLPRLEELAARLGQLRVARFAIAFLVQPVLEQVLVREVLLRGRQNDLGTHQAIRLPVL